MYIATAGQVIGLLGAAKSAFGGDKNGGAGTQSQSRDPWAAAAPYMRENLRKNAQLQGFYEQNPFNDQQKTGYQNQNNTIDQFNGSVAPGLLNFANGMMGQSYQRQRGGAPGDGAGYGGLLQGAGMQTDAPRGLFAGPFSAPQHQAFGQIDWNKMNPFSEQNKAAMNTNVPMSPETFDEAAYFAANPDILESGWDRGGYDHYMRAGQKEGRKLTPFGG